MEHHTVKGLWIFEDWITEEYESRVVIALDKEPWNTVLSRRTQHYGYDYDYRLGMVSPTIPMISELKRVAESIDKQIDMKPNQCIVNEYAPGQRIAPHVDAAMFDGVIASVSLCEDGEYILSLGSVKVKVPIRRRSLVLLTKDARWFWKHSFTAPSCSYRRISLTYRVVKSSCSRS